jgi:hypothetical protein
MAPTAIGIRNDLPTSMSGAPLPMSALGSSE